jgi:hypothetical protein
LVSRVSFRLTQNLGFRLKKRKVRPLHYFEASRVSRVGVGLSHPKLGFRLKNKGAEPLFIIFEASRVSQ